ncbi:prolipoprotein diacylglyceryl transferase [Motilimonas eburnea]|uniref:prolipoprotein diacylglyceryl transferase n=1 Tax=Motilimonas eburnea TaxID=1737488 RepID=UPI001E47B7B2|nr:prolipoprotein diacylglyceryl transferase [Motilimonas eburnea]MCE2571393.1 prolipoprotein diacylglyceryl transferase [Motilimonas eburnea]
MSETFWSFPQIDPVIFSVGPLAVRWYGVMYLVGFVFAMWMANRRAMKPGSGWTKDEVSDVLFYGFLGVIIGGRMGYVIFYQTSQFLDNPLYLLKIWEGGMSFHGGLLGVIVAMLWFAKKTNRRFFAVADFIAPLIPVGLGAGRFGNFINGELWGRVTDGPWGMVFPGAGPDPRHPSQLYEFALEGVVLFIMLYFYSNKPRPLGAISGLFLLGYGTFRFTIEFAREPDAHLGLLTLGLSMGQLLSLPMMIAGLIFMVWAYKQPAVSAKA